MCLQQLSIAQSGLGVYRSCNSPGKFMLHGVVAKPNCFEQQSEQLSATTDISTTE